jgi:hypothetical protein
MLIGFECMGINIISRKVEMFLSSMTAYRTESEKGRSLLRINSWFTLRKFPAAWTEVQILVPQELYLETEYIHNE